MVERPYSRYSRAKTWAALYSQHTSACYALVPYSATNNSIAVIRCTSPEETQRTMHALLQAADACAAYYTTKQTPDQAPTILAKARHAVVLAKSSDYYHYHLSDHPELGLVVCGLHDSYLHLPVWEMCSNQRYGPRETAISLSSPDFDRIRVQPLSVVDKSNFSPSRLTFPLDGPYSSFSEGNRPFTSFQAKRISS